MYYFRKPMVFIVNDDAVASEIDRLSRDELEFSSYVSKLVEKDILEKLGRKFYDDNQIIESNVTAVSKRPSSSDGMMSEVLEKLDRILAMGSLPNVNASQSQTVQSSYVQQPQTNQNQSLAIEVPVKESQVQDVGEVVEVKEIKETPAKKSKGKKKGLFSTKGRTDILSKMASMQK